MHKTTRPDYNGALARAEAAARTRDSAQFVGALRDAFSQGYHPVHIPSSWLSLISDAGESLESLRPKVGGEIKHNPRIGNPPYTQMPEYKGKPLTSEVYHDYLLKETFKPFGSTPAAGWELERRLSELHAIGVDLHDYSKADAHMLRSFWPNVVSAVREHAESLIGKEFVERARAKYADNRFA